MAYRAAHIPLPCFCAWLPSSRTHTIPLPPNQTGSVSAVTAAFAQTRNSPLERGNHQSTGRFKFPKGQLTRVNNPRSRKNTLMRVRQPLPCHTSRDQSCCRVVKFGIVGRQVPARSSRFSLVVCQKTHQTRALLPSFWFPSFLIGRPPAVSLLHRNSVRHHAPSLSECPPLLF